MRLWYFYPEGLFFRIVPRSTRRFRLACLGMGILVIHATNGVLLGGSSAFASAAPLQIQRSGKTVSPHIGAAMAVLATLEQARVLPPEGTTEANRIIKSVIQLQSLFIKNADPAVQEFLRRAVAIRQREQTEQILAQFHSGGWNSDVLEALADGTLRSPTEELVRLAPGLATVNLSVDDLQHFMQLVRDGEQALIDAGKNFHEVFAFHRKTLPGTPGR